MLVKSGLEFSILKLKVAAAQSKKIVPERLNWPGRLAGISEGARSILKWKILAHFSSSFLSQKWSFQELRVSPLIRWVLGSAVRNLNREGFEPINKTFLGGFPPFSSSSYGPAKNKENIVLVNDFMTKHGVH